MTGAEADATVKPSGPRTPASVRRDWRSPIVLVLAIVVLLAGVVYPVRRYTVEPQRQDLLGYREPPARRLALASQFGFDTAGGSRIRLVPGRPALDLNDLPGQTVMTILGGFRGPYVIWLWIKVNEDKQQKVHFELVDLYKKILLFQGDYPGVWSYVPWDMVWNVSVQWQSMERKYQWIRTGVALVNEGYRRHPRSAEIMEAMGRIYGEKLGLSQEGPYYRQRVREDDGRSTFLIAYEWYDLCRRTNERYGTLGHYGLTRPAIYSQACHNLSYYAKELTERSYDAFQASLDAREKGQSARADELFDQGLTELSSAIGAWRWASREWAEQTVRFEKEGVPAVLVERYRYFYVEAEDAATDLDALYLLVNVENLPELFPDMHRPEIE